MRRIAAVIIATLIATSLFAHGGHTHNYLGTVKAVDGWHMILKTEDAKEHEFELTRETRYTRNGDSVSKGALKAGLRVSVYVADDGKTVTRVLLPAKIN